MENLRTLNTTLMLLKKDDKLLLGEKKRGFAKGTLNGIGGKQDPGETIEQAMVRETQEEIGITPKDYELSGKIFFDVWYKGEHVNMVMHIYEAHDYVGEIRETEEMLPNWYDVDKIPYDKMLEDDKLWLDLFLQGKKFIGKCKFDPNMHMLSHEFKAIDKISEDEKFC